MFEKLKNFLLPKQKSDYEKEFDRIYKEERMKIIPELVKGRVKIEMANELENIKQKPIQQAKSAPQPQQSGMDKFKNWIRETAPNIEAQAQKDRNAINFGNYKSEPFVINYGKEPKREKKYIKRMYLHLRKEHPSTRKRMKIRR